MKHRGFLRLGAAALALAFFALAPLVAEAELLQIIHTNDLHSYFEHSQNADRGGYPAVKAEIDRLKAEAQAQGIETLVLDAGDFGDGAPLYFADRGESSWNLLNAIGYDAVVFGNHDYLPGQPDLDRIVSNIQPKFSLLAANFDVSAEQPNLRRHVKPYLELRKAGLRIGILGITNTEWAYSWRVGPTAIRPMRETWMRFAPELKRRNDLVIALTHLGIDTDKRMVAKTHGADLVVGGHSHDFLEDAVWVNDARGNPVPIVQAGEHGEAVGDLLIDVTPGKPVQVLRYRLVPVYSAGPKNPVVQQAVESARASFETQYGHHWLHESVGHTAVQLHGPNTGNCRPGTDLVVRAFANAAGVEIGLDNEEFYGMAIPPGDITREQIIGLYPRIYSFRNTMGWTVWKARVHGAVLKSLMDLVLQAGYVANVWGVTFDVEAGSGGKPQIVNLKVGGEPLRAAKRYSVALPEGMALWMRDATTLMQFFVTQGLTDTHIPVWTAVERELKRMGGRVAHPREQPSPNVGVQLPGMSDCLGGSSNR
ncbi:MAG: bifunctional metallophosphatase/5'-nucleotidase [Bdellovibrionales bacterium]|nr:bifunctional metallophosphatase/5'-nucleotidase [Bdellovibrionales bacterium]